MMPAMCYRKRTQARDVLILVRRVEAAVAKAVIVEMTTSDKDRIIRLRLREPTRYGKGVEC